MNIWNKVFVGLIIVVSLVFFYFSVQVLRTHEHWRSSAKAHDKKIVQLDDEIEEIRYGVKDDADQPGLLKMQSAVYKSLIGRGRVWYNCKPQMADPKIGAVRVTTDFPDPHGITDKTVLAVFDENKPNAGGRYIGRFVVKQVDETKKLVGLVPSRPLRPAALKRLAASRGPWTLCETVPSDNHEIFAGMTPEGLEQILPKVTLDEYVKDGKDDFERKLRDYRFLFDTFARQRAIMTEAYNSAAANKGLMDEAVADAKVQVQFRQAEITALGKELAEMTRQRDIVLAHQKSLEAEIADRTKAIEELTKSNRELAAQIAKDQLEAVRRVDTRTASIK
ncbi:MAG: hypothetical protein U9N87_04165 [Planctomycetota bacterium]|nr:hypothetical protein [Planctomycetota bacterium]